MQNRIASVLSIGGLDPSGGAGLLADARAVAGIGGGAVHCLGVATAIVAQNTRGVALSSPVAPGVLRAQIEALLADIRPAAIKIGLIPNLAAVDVLAEILIPPCQWRTRASATSSPPIPLVIDTVFAPTTGAIFSDEATIAAIKTRLLPLATIVTPNALEAVQLGSAPFSDAISTRQAAREIWAQSGAQCVLLKGGHSNDAEFATDLFFDGAQEFELRARRENGYEVRGTGCLLASALAARLALGQTPREAAIAAKSWLTQVYLGAQIVGGGRRVAAIGMLDETVKTAPK